MTELAGRKNEKRTNMITIRKITMVGLLTISCIAGVVNLQAMEPLVLVDETPVTERVLAGALATQGGQDTFRRAQLGLAIAKRAAGEIVEVVDALAPHVLGFGRQCFEMVRDHADRIARNEKLIQTVGVPDEQKVEAGAEIEKLRALQREAIHEARKATFLRCGVKDRDEEKDKQSAEVVKAEEPAKPDMFAPIKKGGFSVALIGAACRELSSFHMKCKAPHKRLASSDDVKQKDEAAKDLALLAEHEQRDVKTLALLLSEELAIKEHDILTIYQTVGIGLEVAIGGALESWEKGREALESVKQLVFHIASAGQDIEAVRDQGIVAATIQAVTIWAVRVKEVVPQEIVALRKNLTDIHRHYKALLGREEKLALATVGVSQESKQRSLIALRELRKQESEAMAGELVRFTQTGFGKELAAHDAVFAGRVLQLVADGSQGAIERLHAGKSLLVDITKKYPVVGFVLSDALEGFQGAVAGALEGGVSKGAQVFEKYAQQEDLDIRELDDRISIAQVHAQNDDEAIREPARELLMRLTREKETRTANMEKMARALDGGAKAIGSLGQSIIDVVDIFRSEIDNRVEVREKQTFEEAYLLSDFIVRKCEQDVAILELQMKDLSLDLVDQERILADEQHRVDKREAKIKDYQAIIDGDDDQSVRERAFADRKLAREKMDVLQKVLTQAQRKYAVMKKDKILVYRLILSRRAEMAEALSKIDISSLVNERPENKNPRVEVVEEVPVAAAVPQERSRERGMPLVSLRDLRKK